jgi:LacI family transcriptional regulator
MVDMAYVYDRRGAHLKGGRTYGLGLVLTDIHNPALADLAMALEDAAIQSDCSVMMGFTGDDIKKQARIVVAMMEYRLDGIVLSPSTGTSAADLMPMVRARIPHVLVTRRVHGFDSPYVGPNNSLGGRFLADCLNSIGARSVAFLGGSAGVSARLERVKGLRDRWKEIGHTWRPETSIATNALEAGGHEAVRILMDSGAMPDAIVSYSDTVARGILAELRARGVEPGVDVAIASFDNDPVGPHLNPSLTSVDTFMGSVGTEALRLLLSQTADYDQPPEKILIKPELHVRESTRRYVARKARAAPIGRDGETVKNKSRSFTAVK